MKIKGHSIIELTNVNTGKKEHYEDDNMVTNALQLYLNDLGMFNISPIHMSAVRENLIPKLLGGILAFDTALTENASNVICPSGVKMTANGSYNVTSNDTVTEMGSFNSSESGWLSDGKYKMVWDFTTTQANGNINCICLTSANHGYIGEGNSTSNTAKSTKMSDFEYCGTAQSVGVDGMPQTRSRIVRGSYANSTITLVDYYNLIPTTDHTSEHMSATGKVKLKTYQVPMSKLDLRSGYPAYATGSGNEYIPVTETEITLPSAFVNALNSGAPSWYRKVGPYYYMIAGIRLADYGAGSVGIFPSDAVWQVVRINSDNTVTSFTVSNPAGTQFDFWINSIALSSDTIFLSEYKSTAPFTHYFEDLADNTDVTIKSNSAIGYGSVSSFMYATEEVAFMGSTKIDMGEREIYPTNDSGRTYQPAIQILDDNKLVSACWDSSYLELFSVYKSTNYLATINNLSSQVTKTAEKTMKITYVLTFVD